LHYPILQLPSLKEFLSLSVTPETIPTQGGSTTISISIDTTCIKAIYLLTVLPPGATEVIEDIKEDFHEADITWYNFKTVLKDIISQYEDSTTIWYRFDYLFSGDTDDWAFPSEGWKTFLGDDEANTNMMGEYCVLVMSLCFNCERCCLSIGFDCARAPFFVVPEFPFGTILPVLTGLSGMVAYSVRKNRRRN
jgi:hypothetical protein